MLGRGRPPPPVVAEDHQVHAYNPAVPETLPLWPATHPLLIAGPCVIEDAEQTINSAQVLAEAAAARGLPFVFKASFDKANRTAGTSWRGPGMHAGLAVLARIRELGIPVLTDIHEPAQAPVVAEVADVLQIPAFLCRQTDLLAAAGETGRIVNIKKGQFLAPWQSGPAVAKVGSAPEVWITERGTSFGHGDLVVDFRGLADLSQSGARPVFDASHAAQRPGGHGNSSGGDRAAIPLLVGAAAGAGYDGLFLEVHPEPARARSDAGSQLPLSAFADLIDQLRRYRDLYLEAAP